MSSLATARAALTNAALSRAVRAIADRCDGAVADDGVGFSGTDAPFGKMAASVAPGSWTSEMAWSVHQMLVKYRRQLADVGISYDQLPEPPAVGEGRATKATIRAAEVVGPEVVFRFGYNPDLAARLKTRLPYALGRRYEPEDRTWRVPVAHADKALAFAVDEEFGVAASLRHAAERGPVPASTAPPTGRVSLVNGGQMLLVAFPYDRTATNLMACIPGASRDAGKHAWRVPVGQIRRVKVAAAAFHWALSPEVEAIPDADPDKPLVKVHVDGGDVEVGFAYHPDLANALRGIEGAYPLADRWRVPVEAAAALIHCLEGYRLAGEIDWTSLREAAQAMGRRVALSSATDAPDFVVPDGFKGTPKGFQKAAAAYGLEVRGAFLSMKTGLGKTVTALLAAEADGAYPLLVVCPASLKIQWAREVHRFLPHRPVAVLHGMKPTDFGMFQPDVLIVNYDIIRPEEGEWGEPGGWTGELKRLRPKGLVVDESQYVKGPTSLRTLACQEISTTMRPRALRINLTATPVINQRAELGPQLAVIGRLEEFGGQAKVKSMSDINRRMRARCLYRVRHEDVMDQVPALNWDGDQNGVEPRRPTYVEGDPAVMKEYRRAEADLLRYLGDKAAAAARELGEDPHSAAVQARMRVGGRAEALVKITTCKQLAAKARLGSIHTWVRDFLYGEDKLLVFAHHTAILEAIATQARGNVLAGGLTDTEKQRRIDGFQGDPAHRVLVCGITASGIGLTLTAANTILFAERPWSPATESQAVARAWGRLNDLHACTVTTLVTADTIDADIDALLEDKRGEIDSATDGVDAEKTSVFNALVESLTNRALGG